jgi:hypothetical protein
VKLRDVSGTTAKRPLHACCVHDAEEASLREEYTRAHIKACDVLLYQMRRAKDGRKGCQCQVQYCYEMEVSEDVVMEPCDGEVKGFWLMGLEDVIAALRRESLNSIVG